MTDNTTDGLKHHCTFTHDRGKIDYDNVVQIDEDGSTFHGKVCEKSLGRKKGDAGMVTSTSKD